MLCLFYIWYFLAKRKQKDAYGLYEPNSETHKKLQTIGQNGYFNIYSKIIEIMERCDEISTSNCPEFMKAGIDALNKNISAEVFFVYKSYKK